MDQHRACRAVADWYHGFFVGLVLRTVVQKGTDDAAKLVFRTIRTQHHRRFLPGLQKLGLTGLPHAVAAAQYHYLSNRIGGVSVEYMPCSDRKARVRFPPPRWAWRGVAIRGIPTPVSEAMLRGWQAHNGVSLGNPRLGFVCTRMAVDGDAGLEGYFQEYDHALAPEDRLRFARHEDAPPFDPALAPQLDWPAERLAEAQGDDATVTTGPDGITVQQTNVRLIADIANPHPAIQECWAALLDGALAAHNHRLSMRRDGLIWRIASGEPDGVRQ